MQIQVSDPDPHYKVWVHITDLKTYLKVYMEPFLPPFGTSLNSSETCTFVQTTTSDSYCKRTNLCIVYYMYNITDKA